MKRQNLRTVSLVVVTFTYLLFGAAIFGWLESDHELRQREALEFIEQIIRNKYNITDDDYTVLTTTVIKSVPHKAGIQWKFPGAFYFATTVVTTIGYGHSTPSTVSGRSFCMAYALIGIPLGLVMFQSIGERLNTFVGAALRWAKRCFKSKNPEVTVTNLVMVVSVLSTILMTSMAAVFAKYERWDYFDALYYCFITLTTIGFGDYVALQKESALQSKPEYVILSLVFILFGLSVVSSAVNLLVLKFLTLNTEDERRDEQLRNTAAMNPIQLEGDVITSSAGKLEYVGGARRQPPALTMSQAMARSSIKRDREALLAAANWQRPVKKTQAREQQVAASPTPAPIRRVQSKEATSSAHLSGSLNSEGGGMGVSGGSPLELDLDDDDDETQNYCDKTQATIRGDVVSQMSPQDLKIVCGQQQPSALDERWRETTASSGKGPDDNSGASDDQKDNGSRHHRALVCSSKGGLPVVARGRVRGDPHGHKQLDDELVGDDELFEYYLHQIELDRRDACAYCYCQLPSGDDAPLSTPAKSVSSGPQAAITSPLQSGCRPAVRQWVNNSSPPLCWHRRRRQYEFAFCFPDTQTTTRIAAGASSSTKDVDSCSLGAGGGAHHALRLDQVTGFHEQSDGPTVESGRRIRPRITGSSSSSAVSSTTRPPDDALDLVALSNSSANQQQPVLDLEGGRLSAALASPTTDSVQIGGYRRQHLATTHESCWPAADNCNCDADSKNECRPRELAAQGCRIKHCQGRQKRQHSHHRHHPANGTHHHHLRQQHHHHRHFQQHSIRDHERRKTNRGCPLASSMSVPLDPARCSPPSPNRVIDREDQQADEAAMIAPATSQMGATPAVNQSSCSCSWVSLASACGSPSPGQPLSARLSNTPTYPNEWPPASQNSSSCLVLDPKSLQSHCDHLNGVVAKVHQHRSFGDSNGRRTTTTARLRSQRGLTVDATLFQSSPAIHRSEPHNSLSLGASDAVPPPAGHQNDTKTMISRLTPALHDRSLTDDEQDYGRPQIQNQADPVSLYPFQRGTLRPSNENNNGKQEDLDGPNEAELNASYERRSDRPAALMAVCRCADSNHNSQRRAFTMSGHKPATVQSDRRKSSSSSSQKQYQVAKLVCRCCCPHAECIEYALESVNKRARGQTKVGSPPTMSLAAYDHQAGRLLVGEATSLKDNTTFQENAPKAICDKTRSVDTNTGSVGLSDSESNFSTRADPAATAELGAEMDTTSLARGSAASLSASAIEQNQTNNDTHN